MARVATSTVLYVRFLRQNHTPHYWDAVPDSNGGVACIAIVLVIAVAALACGDTDAPPPVEKIVTVTVEVEKILEVPVEVEKVVEVERIVQATPTAAAEAAETPAATGPAIYKMGLFEDPISEICGTTSEGRPGRSGPVT